MRKSALSCLKSRPGFLCVCWNAQQTSFILESFGGSCLSFVAENAAKSQSSPVKSHFNATLINKSVNYTAKPTPKEEQYATFGNLSHPWRNHSPVLRPEPLNQEIDGENLLGSKVTILIPSVLLSDEWVVKCDHCSWLKKKYWNTAQTGSSKHYSHASQRKSCLFTLSLKHSLLIPPLTHTTL